MELIFSKQDFLLSDDLNFEQIRCSSNRISKISIQHILLLIWWVYLVSWFFNLLPTFNWEDLVVDNFKLHRISNLLKVILLITILVLNLHHYLIWDWNCKWSGISPRLFLHTAFGSLSDTVRCLISINNRIGALIPIEGVRITQERGVWIVFFILCKTLVFHTLMHQASDARLVGLQILCWQTLNYWEWFRLAMRKLIRGSCKFWMDMLGSDE